MTLGCVLVSSALIGCGSQQPNPGPTDAVREFIRAIGSGDGASACRTLTPRQQRLEGESARFEHLGSSCATTLSRFVTRIAPSRRSEFLNVKFAAVSISGTTATLSVVGGSRPLTLQMTDGRWRIATDMVGAYEAHLTGPGSSAIRPSQHVRFRGLVTGEVESVRRSPSGSTVTFSANLAPAVLLHADAALMIYAVVPSGLAAGSFDLELNPGTAQAPLLVGATVNARLGGVLSFLCESPKLRRGLSAESAHVKKAIARFCDAGAP